jgi:type IV pilus assembly protein PilW
MLVTSTVRSLAQRLVRRAAKQRPGAFVSRTGERPPSTFASRAAGVSLVELMVALAIGAIILAALAAVFFASSLSRRETDRGSRQVENGRYAMQLLTSELKLAGYYSEFDPNVLLLTGVTMPDPCSTVVADLNAALPLHVQGVDNPSGTTIPSCVTDLRAGTDVLVIRRTATCVRGTANCDAIVAGTPWFQASLCGSITELFSLSPADYFTLDTDESRFGGANARHKRDCTAVADVRRFRVDVYFVANNDNAGDGIPTLKRAELGPTGFTIVPLVEGIENMQLEYGIDTGCSATNPGTACVFTANPTAYNGCAGAACLLNWRNVMAVRLNLLARTTDTSPNHSDDKVYNLGKKFDGTDNLFPPSGSGYGDGYKRHVFHADVRLSNPAGRRIVP